MHSFWALPVRILHPQSDPLCSKVSSAQADIDEGSASESDTAALAAVMGVEAATAGWAPYESPRSLMDVTLCAAIEALLPCHRVPFVHEEDSVGGLGMLPM